LGEEESGTNKTLVFLLAAFSLGNT